jgi:hypothetical protein
MSDKRSNKKGSAKKHKSEKAKLREFGITLGCAFGVLGGLLLWRDKSHYVYFFAASGVFFLLGLAVPVVLRPVEKAWMKLSLALGWVMTRVILTVLFFAVFTPIGAVSRLFGKRFLCLETDESCDTYWEYKEPRELKESDYERQY